MAICNICSVPVPVSCEFCDLCDDLLQSMIVIPTDFECEICYLTFPTKMALFRHRYRLKIEDPMDDAVDMLFDEFDSTP
jgi:hypothetical protein